MEPDPTVRAYIDHPEIARDYDRYFARHPLFSLDGTFLLDHIAPGSRTLDLGCGTGRHMELLARRGGQVVGVDRSAHMLSAAAEKFGGRGTSVRLVRADMLALPLAADVRFDAILLMFSTLGLVHPASVRKRLLRDLAGRLAPEGRLILHVHNHNYHRSVHQVLANWARDTLEVVRGRFEPGDHLIRNYRGVVDLRIHSFTLEELRGLLRATGLSEVRLEGLNDRRDDYYAGDDLDRGPNGYLLAAGRRIAGDIEASM
jgi:ubiquinone/menaquinone biosynthesis C-methylase UbiE